MDTITPVMRLAVLTAELADTCPADALGRSAYGRFEVEHGCADRCGHCSVAECWAAWAEMDRGGETVTVCATCLAQTSQPYCSAACESADRSAFEGAHPHG